MTISETGKNTTYSKTLINDAVQAYIYAEFHPEREDNLENLRSAVAALTPAEKEVYRHRVRKWDRKKSQRKVPGSQE